MVSQAIAAGAGIERCVIAPALLAGDAAWEVVSTLRARGVPVLELSPNAFASISFKENLQGIGAIVRARLGSVADSRLEQGRLAWVALSDVGNPGNLGAVLRTCDAVGCDGVVLLGETTDPYHPAALRASRGTIFSLQLVRATFQEFARWKQTQPACVVGTVPDAGLEYRQVRYETPLILLMGSERLGLSAEQQAVCDLLVRIPMVGRGDSLNLAVATSVLLYEVFDQHRRAAVHAAPSK
jgi:TrmH family RNA methyltransferase